MKRCTVRTGAAHSPSPWWLDSGFILNVLAHGSPLVSIQERSRTVLALGLPKPELSPQRGPGNSEEEEEHLKPRHGRTRPARSHCEPGQTVAPRSSACVTSTRRRAPPPVF